MCEVIYPNLDTPKDDMTYEVERFLSFSNVDMLLTASQLSNNGFFYNVQKKKIICFSCQKEHDTKVCNITHEPLCKFKQNNNPFHIDNNFESTVDFVQHAPKPPITSRRELNMKNEDDRLKTFSTWDESIPVKPDDLARNGFYYKGFADVVVCAYCRLELRNWEEGDHVYTEHQRHNRSCPFLITVLELQQASAILNMKYEQNRIKTFENVSETFVVCTKALAQNGFYFVGGKDTVCCVSCKHELSNWKKEDNIKQRHAITAPSCPFVISEDSTSLPHYRSNIIFDRPKHPQFSLLGDRLKTFIRWPTDKKQTPQLLADAGFYHTGESDTVICYCCDGGLCNWDEEDDPWIEHARWYPRCTYVRQRKGDQFVASVKRDEPSSDPNSTESKVDYPTDFVAFEGQKLLANSDVQVQQKDAASKMTLNITKSPTVLAVLQLGYDEKIVDYVVRKKVQETGSPFAKASLLLEAVVDHMAEVGSDIPQIQSEKFDELPIPENKMDKRLQEENRLLKEQKTCKICLDDDLSIVFLPCGHFVSCATCAPSLKTCPLCRSQILGLVRAYLS